MTTSKAFRKVQKIQTYFFNAQVNATQDLLNKGYKMSNSRNKNPEIKKNFQIPGLKSWEQKSPVKISWDFSRFSNQILDSWYFEIFRISHTRFFRGFYFSITVPGISGFFDLPQNWKSHPEANSAYRSVLRTRTRLELSEGMISFEKLSRVISVLTWWE